VGNVVDQAAGASCVWVCLRVVRASTALKPLLMLVQIVVGTYPEMSHGLDAYPVGSMELLLDLGIETHVTGMDFDALHCIDHGH